MTLLPSCMEISLHKQPGCLNEKEDREIFIQVVRNGVPLGERFSYDITRCFIKI